MPVSAPPIRSPVPFAATTAAPSIRSPVWLSVTVPAMVPVSLTISNGAGPAVNAAVPLRRETVGSYPPAAVGFVTGSSIVAIPMTSPGSTVGGSEITVSKLTVTDSAVESSEIGSGLPPLIIT